MAHIPDGVLAAPVLIGGAVVAAGLVAVALRRLDDDRIPEAAVLAAAFFLLSLIHLPIGPTSVHPLLVGLMGLVLGWAAVPAILVALVLQAAFFGFGGVMVLGANTVILSLPALAVALAFGGPISRAESPARVWALGAAAGACGVLLTAALLSAALALSSQAYLPAVPIILATYAPLALVEAVLTGAAARLLKRVRPGALAGLAASGAGLGVR